MWNVYLDGQFIRSFHSEDEATDWILMYDGNLSPCMDFEPIED